MIIYEQLYNSSYNKEEIRKLLVNDISDKDRELRFAHPVSIEYVENYVKDIFYSDNGKVIFGAYTLTTMPGSLVGFIEVTNLPNNAAEIALVVDPNFRGMGIGSKLLNMAMSYITNRGIDKVYSLCLTNNSPMMKLVKKNGFKISSLYGESEAIKTPGFPTIFTISEELEGKFFGGLGVMSSYNITNWNKFWSNLFYEGIKNDITKNKN